MKISEVEVWTEPRCDSDQIDWTIRIDGKDHGGGTVGTHAQGHADAAAYLRDLETPSTETEGGT